MSRFYFLSVLLVLVCTGVARALPACYDTAPLPAHVWATQPQRAAQHDAVTFLAEDGQTCKTIPLWQGMPLLRSEMYVSFRTLYNAYAEATTRKDSLAIQRLYTWLRPTPRPFPLWMALFTAEEGAPQPWGIQGMTTLVRLLQTDSGWGVELPTDAAQLQRELHMVWPLLYLYMGGTVLPSDELLVSHVSYGPSHYTGHIFHAQFYTNISQGNWIVGKPY